MLSLSFLAFHPQLEDHNMEFSIFASSVVVVLMMMVVGMADGQLIAGFYNDKACPAAEPIVKDVVTNAVKQDRTMAASLLRLHFHDCFVQGCDGSILLDPQSRYPPTEKEANPNLSLRGYKVIDAAKEALENACPETVSCADIVALAARDAVYLAGGAFWPVPTGRRDGWISLRAEADRYIPPTFEDSEELTQRFLDVGLTQDEMITLSGAHTIGRAHCVSFIHRLYNFSSRWNTDPTLNPSYAARLKEACPPNPNPHTVVPLDPVTPALFDNNYYTNLRNNMGLMASDQTLHSDMITQSSSELNAGDSSMWQTKFGDAIVRMGSINVKTGEDGEIRKNCRFRN